MEEKWTKAQAARDFNETIKPQVFAKYGKHDKDAMREAWGNYTDYLCKDGKITLKQYETWTNPY